MSTKSTITRLPLDGSAPGEEQPAPETASEGTAKSRGKPAEAGKGATADQPPGEIGGPQGPEPTRYGDWEVGGRCTDF
ncbi:MAG: DUF1674 domain-containing protein [Azospirillaceae bacterium]